MHTATADTDLQQRKVFASDVLAVSEPAPDRQYANLYLAMIAAGKLQPLPAKTNVNAVESGVSKFRLQIQNRKSKIQIRNFYPDCIYTYDLNGNRASMIDPTGLTTYAYDALNRLTSITNNKGQVTSFTYDALVDELLMTHANGVVTNYTYDAASQLLSLIISGAT